MALDIALREGGIIVNTDSMQAYSPCSMCLPRSPPADERRRVPHELYGHVHPSCRLFDRCLVVRRIRGLARGGAS